MFTKKLTHSYAPEMGDVAVDFLRYEVECLAVDIFVPHEVFLSHRRMVVGTLLDSLDLRDRLAELSGEPGKSRLMESFAVGRVDEFCEIR